VAGRAVEQRPERLRHGEALLLDVSLSPAPPPTSPRTWLADLEKARADAQDRPAEAAPHFLQGVALTWSLYDAEHAFGRDIGARYDPEATDQALAETVALFRRALTPAGR